MGRSRSELGHEAESLAAAFLERGGYAIVARNVRSQGGELDLVVEKGELLCFVEVRMRSSDTFGDPALTITWQKQRRVVTSAVRFLQKKHIRDRAIRFDVITVLGQGKDAVLEHIPNAFEAGL